MSRGGQRGHFWFAGDNPLTIVSTSSKARAEFRNSALITYYLGRQTDEEVTLKISDLYGRHERVTPLKGEAGLHRYQWTWDLIRPPTLPNKNNASTGFLKH